MNHILQYSCISFHLNNMCMSEKFAKFDQNLPRSIVATVLKIGHSTVGAQVSRAQKSCTKKSALNSLHSKVGAQMLPRSIVTRVKVRAQLLALKYPVFKSRRSIVHAQLSYAQKSALKIYRAQFLCAQKSALKCLALKSQRSILCAQKSALKCCRAQFSRA